MWSKACCTLDGAALLALALQAAHQHASCTLQGHVEGDAGELLDALADNGNGAASAVALHIDCGRLIRVDFAAAGSVLNWAARQQAMGRSIHFERMNRMVAVFFNVIGISEYAAVQPRKD